VSELSTTSYALLGLLAFDGTTSTSLTGYELKQRADRTLRFYWVSPAMSQVYTELDRLTRLDLVSATREQTGRRSSRRYQITETGYASLQQWLSGTDADFPVLKHPVALRLLMGAMVEPPRLRELLQDYLDALAQRRVELASVRTMLGDAEAVQYPAMVAEWGLGYYDAEADIVRTLLDRLTQSATAPTRQQPSSPGPAGPGQDPQLHPPRRLLPAGAGRNRHMTSTSGDADELDQDSEPTMMAPLEGRPTGIEDDTVAETQDDVTSPDADDQTATESPEGE
jgi:DNA-binding PadR family transcriptional regulator